MPRAKGVQIYLKPGLEEDDRLLAFWHASQRHSRPQEVFRRLLQIGLDELIQRGEVSARVLEEMNLEMAEQAVDPLDTPAAPKRPAGDPNRHQRRAQQPPARPKTDNPEPDEPIADPEPVKADTPAEDEGPTEFDYRDDRAAFEAEETDPEPVAEPERDLEPVPAVEPEAPRPTPEVDAPKPKPNHAFIGDIM